MLRSLVNRLQFLAERFLVRGPLFRLLFVIGLILGISVVGGLLVYVAGNFDTPGHAIWWAFLRLSDSGYLGDDQGAYVRTISTLLTLAGPVLFLGAMIAIMTQWLNAALRRLENGLTPIADRNHFVVMGWTTRTPNVVRELLSAQERVRQFLRRRGGRALSVVVMAEDVDAGLQQELRERVGSAFRSSRVIMRSGSTLRLEHLRRVAALDAAALLIPAPDHVSSQGAGPDTQTIKTLLSLASFTEQSDPTRAPLVVAELLDARKAITARRAYRGPLEIVASNHLISSLICQNIRHPGLAHVYSALLTHGEGSEIYARLHPEFAGMRFGDLSDAFPKGVLLGVVRTHPGFVQALLNPHDDLVVLETDRLVLVAEDYAATTPPADYHPQRPDRGQGIPSAPQLKAHRRILLLGWSHHVPSILRELDSYQVERFDVTIASLVPTATRHAQLADHEVAPQRVGVEHLELDYTIAGHLRRLNPGSFDNIVFVATDAFESDEADARTILGHLLLRELVPDEAGSPDVLVELVDPENLALFQRGRSEVIIPPTLLSHILAQVALRRELRVVFEDLFGPEGSEIFFRPAPDYGLVGREVNFGEIRHAVARHNETALGLRLHARGQTGDDEFLINPPGDRTWSLTAGDQLVVVASYAC